MAALKGLVGEKVVYGANLEEVDVDTFAGEGKVLGIYFSAHWCPPCRAFTPQLATWYKNFKKGPNGDKFNLMFVSSDRDEQSFKEYFAEMPWHALPYAEREKKVGLVDTYTRVLHMNNIHANGNIIHGVAGVGAGGCGIYKYIYALLTSRGGYCIDIICLQNLQISMVMSHACLRLTLRSKATRIQ